MSDYQYEDDSYQGGYEQEQECLPKRKRLTKNQQIYGDFEEAYEPQLEEPTLFRGQPQSYDMFKAGSTMERHSQEVEVTLPKSKPKTRKVNDEEGEQKPMLGKFNLNSFLQQMGGQMDDIVEAVNEDSSQEDRRPQGLNGSILKALQLVKIGQEPEEQIASLQEMSYRDYMKLNKSHARPKEEPKYKTQEEKELAQEFKEGYGVGFKMMEKMGFNVKKGLGKEETGIHRPVEAIHKTAFTMKDELKREGEEKESEGSEEQHEEEMSMEDKLFQYRSRNKAINNFLMDLKRNFEQLTHDIYFLENEIQSFQKQQDIKESLLAQAHNQRIQLVQEIDKLSEVGKDLYQCHLHPHLGLTYQLDYLYAKDSLDKITKASLGQACQTAAKELGRLTSTLSGFYLAKIKETLNEYHKATGVQRKMQKHSNKKKRDEVINVDHFDAEVMVLGSDDQKKIHKFVEMVISRSILPKITAILDRSTSIDKVKDNRVIDLLEVVKQYDRKGGVFTQFIKEKVLPKCQAYIRQFSLEQLTSSTGKIKLPHVVLFPWLPLVGLANLNLDQFFRRLSSKLWNMDNAALHQIISPWFKFAPKTSLDSFISLYLAPRLMHEMETFDLSKANLPLLNGFIAYSEFLPRLLSEEILENTVMLQLLEAYRKYEAEMGTGEVRKWVAKWKSLIGKALPGYVEKYFREMSIVV